MLGQISLFLVARLFFCGDFFGPVLHFEHFELVLDYQNLQTPTPTHGFIHSIFMAFSQYFVLCFADNRIQGWHATASQVYPFEHLSFTTSLARCQPNLTDPLLTYHFRHFFLGLGFKLQIVKSRAPHFGRQICWKRERKACRQRWGSAAHLDVCLPPGPCFDVFRVIPDNAS